MQFCSYFPTLPFFEKCVTIIFSLVRSVEKSKGVLYSYLSNIFVMGKNGSELSKICFLNKYEIWKGDLYLGGIITSNTYEVMFWLSYHVFSC